MYELVITTGYDFKNYKVLMTGTYGEICQMTSTMDGTDDIRKKYKSEIDEFLKRENSFGSIVVLKHPDLDHPQDVEPCRVIYKSDKRIFDKLLVVPQKKDPLFSHWQSFWNHLRTSNPWKKFVPNCQENIIKNEKLEKYSSEFNGCVYRFNKLIKSTSSYLIKNFYPNNKGFSSYVFPNYRRLLKEKGNEELYYEFASIVLKAFDCYMRIYNLYEANGKELFGRYLKLKNNQKNRISHYLKMDEKEMTENEDNNIFVNDDDIYDQDNSIHSSGYIALKPAIDNNDIVTINQFIELYGFDGFTEDELLDIKFIIENNNVHKKR